MSLGSESAIVPIADEANPNVAEGMVHEEESDSDSEIDFGEIAANANANAEPSNTDSVENAIIGAVQSATSALVATAVTVQTEPKTEPNETVNETATAATHAFETSLFSELELNDRKIIEEGLKAFNAMSKSLEFYKKIETAIQFPSDIAFIKLTPSSSPTEQFSGENIVVSYCNPSLGALSDFAPHYNLFIFTRFPPGETPISVIDVTYDALLKNVIKKDAGFEFELRVSFNSGPRISLHLHIGKVFKIPVFTVHVMDHVFDSSRLPRTLESIEPAPFIYNAKPIGPYNRLDLIMELLMHSDATDDDPYAQVNVLVARGMNQLCVKQFVKNDTVMEPSPSPNAVIQQVCVEFAGLLIIPTLKSVQSRLIKHALIAIIQDPSVQTPDKKQFSEIFPSGQYGIYFDQVAHRCDARDAEGGLMIPVGGVGEGSFPLTRTDVIVAALTAVNSGLRTSESHIVAGGGAAVSYYIQEFLQDAESKMFSEEITNASGANMDQVIERCRKIPMNDIDCFVFGDVSRQFLLMFSLYMMVLYENFYERPKRYRNAEATAGQVQKIRFRLSPSFDEHIELFMYGNRNNDANTQLISKRLQKNPKVQLVTQETKCFSQIVHPVCSYFDSGSGSGADALCKEDIYYMQPIDLVKKEIKEFVDLYRISLYEPDNIPLPETIEAMIRTQYLSDNMVSLKTTMLDVICIFCDEGKSLFIRIFMARKNPKDFARLRVFIDLYLLQLLRFNPETFVAAVKDDFIAVVGQLRTKMDELDDKYYLKQGNIAVINVETAAQIDEDRTAFLKLLRIIGRKIVDIPGPFGDRVPAKFQATTGNKIIEFLKADQSMKCRFAMDKHIKHMVELYEHHSSAFGFTEWLNSVFEDIKFPPETKTFFRSKLEQILDSTNPDGNREIGFKEMPVRTPFMLRLHDELMQVKADEALFKRFPAIFNLLLRPVKEYANMVGLLPTAYYVGVKNKSSKRATDGMYDIAVKRRVFPTFVKDVIMRNEMKRNPEISSIMDELNDGNNDYDKYDDAVKEEIGRILLDYNYILKELRGGGNTKTRKRSRRHKKFNAKTRSCGVRNTKLRRRITRAKRSRLNKCKHTCTRRELMH